MIIPYFKEIQHPKFVDYLSFIEAFALFDIAGNTNELKPIILKRLDDNIISKEIMAKRKMLFEKYVSSTDGDATKKHVPLIKKLLTNRIETIY